MSTTLESLNLLEAWLTLLILRFNWFIAGLTEALDILFTDFEVGKGGSGGLLGILKGLRGFGYIFVWDCGVLLIEIVS